MHLHISPDKLISDIQKEFSSSFPFLKLEFFQSRKHKLPHTYPIKVLPITQKIGEIQRGIKAAELSVDSAMKVKDLENNFQDVFSLTVQVFRKSGNLWLETTMTDDWTLQQQNNHGKELSSDHKSKNSAEDFDLVRDADR